MTSIAEERARLADVGLSMRRREDWGATFQLQVNGRWVDGYTTARAVDEPATRLFLHITVTDPDAHRSHDAHWRHVEAIGIRRFPATGISYSAGILPGGLLYEGQPWGRRGAHTVNDHQRATCSTVACPGRGGPLTAPSWNLNVNGRAVALARNLDDEVTDLDVVAAARWGAAHKLAGLADQGARWHGHLCVTAKSCPGSRGFARLGDIADLTADYVRDGLPGTKPPPVTPTPPTRSTDMGFVIVKGRSVNACVTGDRFVPISEQAALNLAAAGLPRTGIPSEDFEMFRTALVAETPPEGWDEEEEPV